MPHDPFAFDSRAEAARDPGPRIVEYVSDYTGETRYAILLDGLYPPELDFDSRDEAEDALEFVREPYSGLDS